MKTQIIQLNKNDDFISVRDKMSWSQTGRILLVWPSDGHVLDRRLELNLVKRHAGKLGAQLALVTHEADIRFIAQQIGIPVFDSPRLAQDTHWRIGRRKSIYHPRRESAASLANIKQSIRLQTQAWREHLTTRIVSLVISVLALFALGIFILPSATIIFTPKVDKQSMTLSLTADPSLKSVNLSTGSLPVYYQEVTIEGHDSLSATGSAIIPDETAITGLSFKNISNHKITIPAGTIVSTIGSNPVRFITTSKEDIVVMEGKSVILSAQAIKPGTSGNLPADTLVALESELGLDFSVTNPYAAHGGTDASVPSPTAQDLRSLRERLVDKLMQSALTELHSLVPAEDTLVPSSLKTLEIIDETFTPAAGEPGDLLNLSLRLRVQSQVVSAANLHSLITPILEANTITGYTPIPDTLILTRLTIPTLGEDGYAHWTVLVQRKLQAEISGIQAINQIKGSTVTEAMDRLHTSQPLAEQVQIKLSPNWWPRLPYLPMRIQVIKVENQ